MGLTGYYKKFINNYDKIVISLTQLLKKGKFVWKEESTVTMRQLKDAITLEPILIVPDFSLPFYIECDASGKGIAVMLS